AFGVSQPASPRDLPQARESRLGLQDFGGVRAVMETELPFGDGARPYQRHFARYHVPQLRKLVDAMAAAEARQAGWHSRIVRALEFRPAIVVDSLDPAGNAPSVAVPHGAYFSIHSGAPRHPTRRCAIGGVRPERMPSASAQITS